MLNAPCFLRSSAMNISTAFAFRIRNCCQVLCWSSQIPFLSRHPITPTPKQIIQRVSHVIGQKQKIKALQSIHVKTTKPTSLLRN